MTDFFTLDWRKSGVADLARRDLAQSLRDWHPARVRTGILLVAWLPEFMLATNVPVQSLLRFEGEFRRLLSGGTAGSTFERACTQSLDLCHARLAEIGRERRGLQEDHPDARPVLMSLASLAFPAHAITDIHRHPALVFALRRVDAHAEMFVVDAPPIAFQPPPVFA